MKLANALLGQAAVIEFQDVPDIHTQCANLQRAQAVLRTSAIHGAMTTTNVLPFQNHADGGLEHQEHQPHIICSTLQARGCTLRELTWVGNTDESARGKSKAGEV